MNYQNLEQNIIDVIKEEQAKLGYRLEEIRLYYPLSSVNHLLNTTGSAEETLQSLADFGAFTADRLGVVTASCRKERFCFYIPEQGSRYVHDQPQEISHFPKLDVTTYSVLTQTKCLMIPTTTH